MTQIHRDYLELAAAAIDFELSPTDRAALARHLGECPECRRRVNALQRDAGAVAGLPRLVLATARTARVERGIGRGRRRGLSTSRLLALAALALLLTLAALTVGAQLLQREPALDLAVVPPTATDDAPSTSPSPGPSFSFPPPAALISPSPVPDPSPDANTAEPSATVAPSEDTLATASPGPSIEASQVPTIAPSLGPVVGPSPAPSIGPTPAPTVAPTVGPTVAPTAPPKPTIAFHFDGLLAHSLWVVNLTSDHADLELALVTQHLDLSACVLTQAIEPDAPGSQPTMLTLPAVATQIVSVIDGMHLFRLSCKTDQGTVEGQIPLKAVDRKPERCAGFAFPAAPISITTLAELNAGIVGTWEGCVTTPWVPTYFVTMTFRADGTYSAVSTEVLDGQDMNALYYGTELDHPAKRYAINDLQASLKGVGQIDIVFDSVWTVNRDDLRNVKLMGDQLEFELFHQATYGPLTFRLFRTGP